MYCKREANFGNFLFAITNYLDPLTLWHKRLGHQSHNALSTMVNKRLADNFLTKQQLSSKFEIVGGQKIKGKIRIVTLAVLGNRVE